ncbi:MAG TPA: translocation/assembly module TamB domain-containing protein, partial [Prosthecobacter sp.]|nr:translocation/assembly module TamB domain-containing protein [Prosthecobacter sp.]
GLDLEWQVRGSVLGDLTVKSLKTKGTGENPWLRHANVERFSVDYDLRALIRKDMEKAIESVTLHRGDMELDLRHLPKKVKIDPAKRKVAAVKPLVWPKMIDIVDVDTTLTLTSGKILVVKGLTLQVGEGMPGIFSCEELRLEPNGVALGPLRAEVQWDSRKVTFRNLVLPQNVVVEQLAADLTRWEEGAITVGANGSLGAARLNLDVKAGGLHEGLQEVQAAVRVTDLRGIELQAFGLPQDVHFDGGRLTLQLSGNPKAAATLKGGAELRAANVQAKGAFLDEVEMALDLDQGTALLKSLRLVRGENLVNGSGKAILPADLAEWRKIQWQAKADGSITNIASLLATPPPISGLYSFNAAAEGVGPTPTKVSGEVRAQKPVFEAYSLPQLRTTFSLDGQEARIEIPALEVGAGNVVDLKAALSLQDAMPVEAQWSVSVTDPPALFATAGLPPLPQKLTGSFQTQGQGKFAVKDLRAKNFANVSSGFTLKGAYVQYGEGLIQALDLKGEIREGELVMQPLLVQIDDRNELRLEGAVGIAAPFVFEAKAGMTLPQLTALNSLLKTFKAPPIDSGSVFGSVNGTGQVSPWQAAGTAKIAATKVRAGKMPQPADAVIDATFEGTRADLGQFEATLGPWKVGAKGLVDKSQVDLAELKVWQNQTLLLNGRAKVPFDALRSSNGPPMDVAVTARDLRVDEILKALGIENIPAGVLTADVQLRGRGENANGKAHVEVKDIKIPRSPKSFGSASAVLDLTLEKKRARILLTAVQPPLQTMTLTADVPVNLAEIAKAPDKFRSTHLNAHLEMPESDLGFVREFAPDLIRAVPARARVIADVRGTVADPRIEAAVDVVAPEVVWMKADLPSIRNVQVRIRATDRILRVEDASVVLAGGRVRIGGTIDATNLKQPAVDLNVEAREALVYRNPTTSLRADGNLTCRGTLASSHVAGQVDLVRGRLFKEIDFMPALSLPSDVPPLPPDTQRRNTQLVLPAFFKDWTFGIRARTRDQFMIAGNVANGAVSGTGSLTGTGAAPVLSGNANVDRMLLRLPYSVIKVTQGAITIDPARPLDPALDIRGESRVGSTDVTIFVYGNSSDPKTRFTSIPPMPEADVVALLATGTAINGSSNEVAADAAGRAIFLFLKELYRKARNKKKVVDEDPPRM